MPAWHGLQQVVAVDVAEAMVADWLAAAGIDAPVAAEEPA